MKKRKTTAPSLTSERLDRQCLSSLATEDKYWAPGWVSDIGKQRGMFGWACTEGRALRARVRSAKPGPDYVCVVKCIEEGSGECLQRAGDGGMEGLLSLSLGLKRLSASVWRAQGLKRSQTCVLADLICKTKTNNNKKKQKKGSAWFSVSKETAPVKKSR